VGRSFRRRFLLLLFALLFHLFFLRLSQELFLLTESCALGAPLKRISSTEHKTNEEVLRKAEENRSLMDIIRTRRKNSEETFEFARTSTMQSRAARAFNVVCPLVWNGLPLALRSLPRVFYPYIDVKNADHKNKKR